MAINGTNGDDVINGTAGNDDIDGRNGDDTIFGLAGNDTIEGGRGNDEAHGGDNDDFIEGEDGNDTLFGDDGNDTLRGVKNDDEIHGGAGNDVIDGGSGGDTITGGEGDDLIDGVSSRDDIDGGDGNDTIDAGSDDDTVDGGAGDDEIEGGSGHDDIDGGSGNDNIEGGSGSDTMAGGEGDDTIIGGSGQDTAVFAGSVADFAISTSGSDLIVDDQNAADGDEGTDTVNNQVAFLQFDDYTLDLTGGNNAPVALVSDQTTDEDSTLTFGLTVVDFDGDAITLDSITIPGTSLSISVVGGPTPGTTGLGSATDFSLSFNPGATFQSLAVGESETEMVVVQTSDANGATNTQTFDITITGVNDAPVIDDAQSDSTGNVQEDGTFLAVGSIVADDIDASDVLQYSVQGGGTGGFGTLGVDSNGDWTYTLANSSQAVQELAGGTNASDDFVIEVSDGNGGTDTIAVSIDIAGENDAPEIDDTLSVSTGSVEEDGILQATGSIIASDIDLGDTPQYAVQGGGVSSLGTLSIDPNGNWTYDLNNAALAVQQLAENQAVSDDFVIEVSDGNGGTDTIAVSIDVSGDNDAPTANDDIPATVEDVAVNIDVLANDSDIDATDTITVNTAGTATRGTVVVEADNTITYTPDADYNGTDSFTYTIEDNNGATDTATVTVSIAPVNDAPESLDLAITANEEDGPFIINLSTQVDDPDGDPLTFSNIRIPFNQAVVPFSIVGNGLIAIDPEVLGLDDGESLSTQFTYTVSDPDGASDDGIVPLTVNGADEVINPPPPNTVPTANPLSISANEADGTIAVNLASLVSDPDVGDILTITALTIDELGGSPLPFTGGITNEEGGGSLFFDPVIFGLEDNQVGTFTLSYTVIDESAASASNDITLVLTGDTPGTGNVAPSAALIITPPGETPKTDSTGIIVSDVIVGDTGTAPIVIDLDNFVSDPTGDGDGDGPLTITVGDLVIGIDETDGSPITASTSFDSNTNELTIPIDDTFPLADGESVIGSLDYFVSDGIATTVGKVTFNYINPEDTAQQQITLDFEEFSDPVEAQIDVSDANVQGFTFNGSAVVVETDEIGGGGRVPTGIESGQTTTPGGDNVLVATSAQVPALDENGFPITEDLLDRNGDPVLDESGNPVQVPVSETEDFAFLGRDAGFGLTETQFLGNGIAGSPPPLPSDPADGIADAFNLDGLSLNVADGGSATVTITTYTMGITEVPNPNFPTSVQFFAAYAEVDSFQFTADSTTPAETLNFNFELDANGDIALDGNGDPIPFADAAGFDDIVAFTVTTDTGTAAVLDDVLIFV